MMKRGLLVFAVAAFIVMAFALSAYAASTTVQVRGRTNPKIVISVDNTSVAFAAFDPDVTQTQVGAFTVTVQSNKDYNYYITAPANFTTSGAATAAISHLSWQRAGGGYFAFAAGNGNDALNGEVKPGTTYTYDLQLTFGYDEEPDLDYSADLLPTALQV